MKTQTIRAFGRTFDTSPSGMLLDAHGNETRFPTMELEIRHAAIPPGHPFHGQVQDGDSIAMHGPVTVATAGDPIETHDHHLLVRNGRMVELHERPTGIMWD